MKFQDLVLCSDLDGTLLNENNEIPKVNLDAIEYFRSQGGQFMIATGRAPDAIFPVIGNLKTDYPCICANGCGIYDLNKRQFLHSVSLDEKVIPVVEEFLRFSENSGVEVVSGDKVYVVKRTAATDFHMSYEKVENFFAEKISDVPKPWLKILFAQKAEETEALNQAFSNSAYAQDYSIVKSHRFYYEILSKGATKGKALKVICDDYHIDLKNVIAIGDNENDISMLDVAGTAVTVANSPDLMKKYASFVTCSNADGAVADLINKLDKKIK